MTSINPQWIEAGTDALMVCLYGDDLGLADRGELFDGQVQVHREQVTDVLAAVVPLIVAELTYTPPAGQRCGHGHDPRHNGSSPLYRRIGCGCGGVCCMSDHEAPA